MRRREAVVETVQGEGAASGDEALFAVLAFSGEAREFGDAREAQPGLSGLVDRLAGFFGLRV